MNNIIWPQKWLLENCYLDLGHYYEIQIKTIGNHRWNVIIQFKDISMEKCEFGTTFVQRDKEDDWTENLEKVISAFRDGCESEKTYHRFDV